MREILFRGKRTDTGEWVFGDLLRGGIDYITAIRTRCGENSYEVVSVDPKTVGEFTGLYDKNLERVFEGDIIKETFEEIGTQYAEISWSKYGYLKISPFGNWLFADIKDCEKVGNIHDNPELLEKK